jgi:hypothetical protein
MSETRWSPEPWKVVPWNTPECLTDIEACEPGSVLAECVDAPDARRIVACVNACAGVSTEELEGLKPGDVASALGRLP